ncbi:MAG: prephenate dehydrogenase/arogenate dehydrogenase family protein [Caldisericum sp.]|nr:prephenate dehydrogenase/arogenate dehydrogenase family protein [Caldisericum sp.]
MEDLFSIFTVGLGLIGGSISLSLKNKWKRYGYDADSSTLKRAIELDVIDEAKTIEEGLKSDVILIAIPVQFILDFIKTHKDKIDRNSILIDTGSTKGKVLEEMKSVNSFYIGGHPLAGKEKGGIENADPNLFLNKPFILTEENNLTKEKLDIVLKLVKDIGSNPVFLNADTHDYILGLTSHLPYVVSLSLFYYLMKKDQGNLFDFAGSGLRDVTRIASGDPMMSYGFVKTNKEKIKVFLTEYIETLKEFLSTIESDDFLHVAEVVKKRRDKIW